MHFRAQKKIAGELFLSDELESDSDGSALTLGDTICDDNEEETFERIYKEESHIKLMQLMNVLLDSRERTILMLRYGLEDDMPLTQREVASKLGISRSYVSRIETKALYKLRNALDKE